MIIIYIYTKGETKDTKTRKQTSKNSFEMTILLIHSLQTHLNTNFLINY